MDREPIVNDPTGVLPNLIIPGAMRAGTTALAAALDKHPDIFVIAMKEPMFFAQRPESVEKLDELLSPDRPRWNSLTPERANNHLDYRKYTESFAPGKGKRYRVDASTTYLSSPDAIRLARTAAPDARFIAVLRDPYKRAFSAYQYQRSHHREPAATFAEAILHERDGKRSDWAYGWRYLGTSLYAEQVERLFAAVPASDRLVITMEDMLAADGMGRIFAFLGLDSRGIALERENAALVPQGGLARMAAQLLNNHRVGATLRKVLPQGAIGPLRRAVRTMRNLVHRNAAPPPSMTDNDRALIADIIEPDIDRLERLLGRDLSQWRYRP